MAVCVVVLALGFMLQKGMPEGFPVAQNKSNPQKTVQLISEIHSRGPVRINEIMSSNGGVLVDADGNTPDWIEIANVGSGAVDLKDYVLARNAKAGNVFQFPQVVLQPGECALVYADSTLPQEGDKELHAPFKVSSTGDVMMLFNPSEAAVDTVNVPPLAENAVYARADANTWQVSGQPTPGLMNTEENYRALTTVTGTSEVQIVELMASTTRYAPDENGVCHDYLILRGSAGSDTDIGGWYLSDTPGMPRMWRFPQGTVIPAGGTLLVHCSGLDRISDPAHLHTNFKLSSEGEQVTLSSASGQPKDQVSYDLLRSDAAYVRQADGSWAAGQPSAPASAQ